MGTFSIFMSAVCGSYLLYAITFTQSDGVKVYSKWSSPLHINDYKLHSCSCYYKIVFMKRVCVIKLKLTPNCTTISK